MVLTAADRRSATGKRWLRRATLGDTAGHPRLPDLIDRLVGERGAVSPAGAEAFLRADLDGPHDPLLLPNLPAALDRIERALRAGEQIAVYGDYDVDGVTATAILVEAIGALGGRVRPYLPHRFSEGYGVNAAALSALHDDGVALVITVDCGISAAAEVAHANERGLDVIVLDHHAIPATLPDAVAVIDPKLDGCVYPCIELCAGALAYKLAGALAARVGGDYDAESHIDLAGLATICDMAPLLGENRVIARRGLAALGSTKRPGLHALARAGGFDLRSTDGDLFGYRIGPRLNAAGRLDHAYVAYELLTTRDERRAHELATELERLNRTRQAETVRAIALAESLLLAEGGCEAPLIFVGHEQMPQGIVGLVASRLAERHNRPAFVFERGDELSRGSARGIPAFDVVGALQDSARLLQRHGGHHQAGGFTVANEHLPALRERLLAHAEAALTGADLSPVVEHDGLIDLDAEAEMLLKWRNHLGPFGVGNPEPLLLAEGLTVLDARAVGDGSHLKLRLRGHGRAWSAIAFGLAAYAPAPGGSIDALLHVRPGRNGTVDLHLRDFAVA
jgi:single-stranded-DNA-specific exonuclease